MDHLMLTLYNIHDLGFYTVFQLQKQSNWERDCRQKHTAAEPFNAPLLMQSGDYKDLDW